MLPAEGTISLSTVVTAKGPGTMKRLAHASLAAKPRFAPVPSWLIGTKKPASALRLSRRCRFMLAAVSTSPTAHVFGVVQAIRDRPRRRGAHSPHADRPRSHAEASCDLR